MTINQMESLSEAVSLKKENEKENIILEIDIYIMLIHNWNSNRIKNK